MTFKEHEMIRNNSNTQWPSLAFAPWLVLYGSQTPQSESFGRLSSSSVEQHASEEFLPPFKKASQAVEESTDRPDTAQFAIFTGESKCSIDWQKPQLTMSALPEYGSNLRCEFGQPMMSSKYSNADQSFGLFPLYGAQCQGRIMLPLNLTAEDGPRYVNAKQYQRILTRLKCRAKEKSENFGRARKPYMHKSRHLHAMRRPRGCGGRFLNTKALKNETAVSMKKTGSDGISPCPKGPQSSEVQQSGSRDSNATKVRNTNRTNVTGLEMASLYSPHRLLTNHVRPCAHPHLRVDNAGHDIVMPGNWAPAADSCCNLKVV
ncbi:nuclear transcription factor Y subunit A-10-like [Rhodamnia argentea]|uniref:Nuclear transcription factor Y subunit n=1 Tax=Rhodamnia argentea TaxID=178133 RepID=A0A8B8PA97_9MYRT|nr:nuclear transcription factor Y subunit A-10-like [Rhodamnia argentea]XP_030531696.1 nuclear transcription factor Y subunit A-10-like [Rhodamnia argentea]XP_048138387.1 nuclear transcription factor Y subunit A-10-like [Rhodamnia argentea]XP_048138388.1 nuclear transcription factor Y subunit A-10-like [Rhodamnia argentea]